MKGNELDMESKTGQHRGREWFDELRENLKKTALLDDRLSKNITLNMFEVDEDCERLMRILREELLPSLHNVDLENQLQKGLINYDIWIEHLMDNLKSLKKHMEKIIDKKSMILREFFHHLAEIWKCDLKLLDTTKRRRLRSHEHSVDIDYAFKGEKIAGESLGIYTLEGTLLYSLIPCKGEKRFGWRQRELDTLYEPTKYAFISESGFEEEFVSMIFDTPRLYHTIALYDIEEERKLNKIGEDPLSLFRLFEGWIGSKHGIRFSEL